MSKNNFFKFKNVQIVCRPTATHTTRQNTQIEASQGTVEEQFAAIQAAAQAETLAAINDILTDDESVDYSTPQTLNTQVVVHNTNPPADTEGASVSLPESATDSSPDSSSIEIIQPIEAREEEEARLPDSPPPRLPPRLVPRQQSQQPTTQPVVLAPPDSPRTNVAAWLVPTSNILRTDTFRPTGGLGPPTAFVAKVTSRCVIVYLNPARRRRRPQGKESSWSLPEALPCPGSNSGLVFSKLLGMNNTHSVSLLDMGMVHPMSTTFIDTSTMITCTGMHLLPLVPGSVSSAVPNALGSARPTGPPLRMLPTPCDPCDVVVDAHRLGRLHHTGVTSLLWLQLHSCFPTTRLALRSLSTDSPTDTEFCSLDSRCCLIIYPP